MEKTGDRVSLHPNPIIFWITLERLHSQMRRLRQQKSARQSHPHHCLLTAAKTLWKCSQIHSVRREEKRLNLSHRLSSIKTEHKTPIDINSDESKEDCSLDSDFW